MSSEGSVTGWLNQLQVGDAAAAQPLWEHYFRRLVALARQRLRGSPRGAADEEDVALSAFATFCRNAERGRFPQLADRDGLWRLLVVLTARKAAHLARDQGRLKRGGGMQPLGGPDKESDLEQLFGREPTPELAAEVAEEYQRLLRALGDRGLETIAVLRMEGHSVEEIADRVGWSIRTIKRKLELIRSAWELEVGV